MSKKNTKAFRKILVANRGEIACRVIQTVQEMGIRAVSVFSEADKKAKHVYLADEAYALPGNKPAETYLNIPLVLDIAKSAGVDAIHPGYGFLSENAAFASACQKAGIVFIGPSPDVIDTMGDKLKAKALMEKAGVPIVPGWMGDAKSEFSEIAAIAKKIGYPVLVKAAAGGGGKGMRLVESEDALKAALETASREAQNAFGDSRVFLEKYITKPRHIEFQILGDTHGNVVHLFERECSIQRRYQKIIEESPSVALTESLRGKMGKAAFDAAKAIGYTNAGTVEFIVSGSDFYFLEVNTRLQVEHPITEMVTQKDLVRLQIEVAQGQALPFSQAELSQHGHAVECRIYAEDPANQFMPSVGEILLYQPPGGVGVRVDDGYAQGYEVTVHYDPMLAKLVCWGVDREQALARMQRALSQYVILGFRHNIAFLKAIIAHPEFAAGNIHTHFLQEHPVSENSTAVPDEAFAAAAFMLEAASLATVKQEGYEMSPESNSPWRALAGWR